MGRSGGRGIRHDGQSHMVHHNVAHGNSTGFGVQGKNIDLQYNSAIDSRVAGFNLLRGSNATIVLNNIYGNNSAPFIGQLNCGEQLSRVVD